jgi:hypothetical protein
MHCCSIGCEGTIDTHRGNCKRYWPCGCPKVDGENRHAHEYVRPASETFVAKIRAAPKNEEAARAFSEAEDRADWRLRDDAWWRR